MAPLTKEEFADLMTGHALHGGRVAVACSGGPDSMALALLLRDWCAARQSTPVALIVDHGLRPESGMEAAQVHQRLTAQGLDTHILTAPKGVAVDRDIQNRARRLRYSLLLQWCRENDIADLFLAHHLDDQGETFMIRLARGSGVDGLAAMSPVELREGVRLHRPLLPVPKRRLEAMLYAAGCAYVRDPSNDRDIFTRVRWRKLMPTLAEEGLTAERLTLASGHMQRAARALSVARQRHLDRSGRLFPDGSCRLILSSFLDVEEDVLLRSLALLLQGVVGADYAPRFDALTRLVEGLKAAALRDGQGFDCTLAGCRLSLRGQVLWIAREFAAIGDDIFLDHAGKSVWDGRFDIDVQRPLDSCRIGAIGPRGWQLLRRSRPELAAQVDDIPAFVREAWPGLWHDDAEVEPILPPVAGEVEKLTILLRSKQFFGSSAFSRPAWNTM